MKNLISILIISTFLSCCSKDTNVIGNPASDQLPPETQTGANTVGCLVNGKVFLPKAEGINPEVNCFYQLVNGEYFFGMAFFDLTNSSSPGVMIQNRKSALIVGQTYILNKNINDNGNFTGSGGNYDPNPSNRFFTNIINSGELKITKLDPANSIISGIFWFDAENAKGEKVQIRQGRFDW
ncbi:hypothetical protein, partial [Flavobacterium sp.]|uniref:hypothetical protein n=1 Tax=Flavobacterium sp. TaxID=239 RepID=UPI00286E1CDD